MGKTSPNGASTRRAPGLPSTEAGQPRLAIELVTLRTHHDEAELPCVFCGSLTRKIYVARERRGKRKIVRAEEAPAFRCENCDYETPRLDAIVEFLAEVVHRIAPTDRVTGKFLKEELAAARRQQKLVNKSPAQGTP